MHNYKKSILLSLLSLLALILASCTSAQQTETPTKNIDPATPAPTASPTAVPPTITASPTLTVTPPLSPDEMQALKDAFNCLTNNLKYASNIKLTDYCPGYWNSTSANISKVDGTLIRKSLLPNLKPLSNLRWKLISVSDLEKDERSTTTNQIYTVTISTLLTGDIMLTCPSGSPAPFQTSVNIPISGEARISVYDYPNQAQKTILIESWTIEGDPLTDFCANLP